MHCIVKLNKLVINVQHLQDTGIGRTVNNLRKFEDNIGEGAKRLVNKWKQMVAASATDTEEEMLEENEHIEPPHVEEPPAPVRPSHSDQPSHEHPSHEHRSHSEEKRSKHSSKHDRHDSVRSSDGTGPSHRERSKEHKSHSNSNKESSTHSSKHKKRSHEESSAHSSSTPKKQKLDSSTSSTSHMDDKNSKNSKKSKSKPTENGIGGDGIEIDNSMGKSFADASGMLEPAPSSSTKSGSSKSIPSSRKSQTAAAVAHALNIISTPALPTLDISRDLSDHVIPNDYRPMPLNTLVMDTICRSVKPPVYMNEAEALYASTTSKNIRTKVYSGVKTGSVHNVPTTFEVSIDCRCNRLSHIHKHIHKYLQTNQFHNLLFPPTQQMCTRFLQKNIDAIEYTGGIPYDVLRPILDRATADQLSNFEHYNPYIMEDTDTLWEHHVRNKFRSAQRREMESWRETYIRCGDEINAKLSSLTSLLKKSHSSAPAGRQIKLAYVETAAKPPRDVAKSQLRNGTSNIIATTPAARVASLSSVSSNIAKVGDVRLKTQAALRESIPVRPTSNGLNKAKKAKKAPLMAKAMQMMQMMKGRFRK